MGKARLVHAVRRIEDLQPGDHLCTFIESQAQHQSIITCFLRIGLEQGQKVLYILHDHNPQQILDYLKVAGLNLALFLERGQIVFITANDLYRRELLDKPNYPVQIIRREVKKAISAGYRALRIVEELSWAESIFGDKALDYLIEYEGLLDKYQKNSRSLMLCLYDRLVFKTDRILDVLHCHPVVIIGTEPTKSLFYIPEERKNDADFHLKSHLDAFVEHRLIEEKMLRLSAIVESSEEAIIGITIDGMIFSWNNGAELLYGYEAAEINGKPVLILAPPGRESEILNNLDQIRAGKRIEHFETVRMRKDGSLVDVSLTVCPIYDINNTITAISVTGHEITGRKRTEAELARHTRELEALYETSLEINSQPDLPTLLQEIVERSAELLGTSIGSLYLVNPDGETLDLKVIYNLPENYRGVTVRFGEGLAGRVAQNGEPLVVNDYWGWEGALDFFRGGPFVRVLGVPLKVRERVFGVVVINSNQPGVFTREDVRVVSLFADQAAIAVENAGFIKVWQSRFRRPRRSTGRRRPCSTPAANPGPWQH